jgi:hypothetical protein
LHSVAFIRSAVLGGGLDRAERRRSSFKAGTEIRLRLYHRNTSDHEIVIPSLGPSGPGQAGLYVEVGDSQGNLAPLTDHYRSIQKEGESGSVYLSRIVPGETYETELVLNRLYDLVKPGRYTIQVHRPFGTGQVVSRSNAITVTVLP